MAESADDRIAEGKLDLVPMIDCIMLMLLFFILTTTFAAEEKSIATMLPTQQGTGTTTQVLVPRPAVGIRIYPAGLEEGLQPSEYAARLREIQPSPLAEIPIAWIRIGTAPPIELVGGPLRGRPNPALAERIERVHREIAEALRTFEDGAAAERRDQPPVTIRCYSGMPWAYALVAYDAVRAYEAAAARPIVGDDRLAVLDRARTVDFAAGPPGRRGAQELGTELFELVNGR